MNLDNNLKTIHLNSMFRIEEKTKLYRSKKINNTNRINIGTLETKLDQKASE